VLPPGPGTPLVTTLRYLRDPIGVLRRCRARHGPMFTMRFTAARPLVLLSSPALLRELFSGPPEVLLAGVANRSVFGTVTGPRSVMVYDGEAHRHRRRLLQPPLRGERMHEYTESIRQLTEAEIATWRPGALFALHPALQRITLATILRTVFGLDEAHADERLESLLRRMANEVVGSRLLLMPLLQRDLGPWSPWGKIVRLVRATDEVLVEALHRRRAAPDAHDRNDLLDLLLDAVDDEGHRLSDEELCDELVTMLMAGHETTGTSLAWIVERVLTHPPVEQRLRDELARVTGGAPVEREHLGELEYLDAVIKEGLRARPITAFGASRRLAAPFTLGGYELPAGINVACCMATLHAEPEVYPEPEAFRPERFLDKRLDQYEWTPFGGGVRRCVGQGFALHEMKIVLATLFQRVRLERRAPARAVVRGFFIAPEGGLVVRMTDAAPRQLRA
jgi:cytochrome P450